MSHMEEFIAFNAVVRLLEECNMDKLLAQTYEKCRKALENNDNTVNYVKEIYAPFTEQRISEKIAQMVTPEGVECQISIIFQTIENLHKACPDNGGDWYFSGNYPTPGGTRCSNRAFVNYFESKYSISR